MLTPVPWIKAVANALTGALVVGSFLLPYIPAESDPRPWWFAVYVAALLVQWVFLSVRVAQRLWHAGARQPAVARFRMGTMSAGALGLALALLVTGEFSAVRGAA